MNQDIVIPSFGPDIPLLRTLIASINKFVPNGLFDNLWLIITDDTDPAEFDFVRSVSMPVTVLHARDIFDPHRGHGQSGYINQQIAKLMIANSIASDWFWIFDSKNFIIKPLDEKVLYREGRARVSVDDPSHHWSDGWNSALEYYGVPYTKAMLNLTPYPVHTASAKKFVNEFADFKTQFTSMYIHDNICEFYIYNAWIAKRGSFDALYQPDGLLRVTVWPTELDIPMFQPENIRLLLENPRWDSPIWCGGLHKNAVRSMTTEHRDRWAEFLVWLGLFADNAAVQSWYVTVLDK
jgi:hypothetical protein